MHENTGIAFPSRMPHLAGFENTFRAPVLKSSLIEFGQQSGLDRSFNTPNRHIAESIHCPHMTAQLQVLCRNNAGTRACPHNRGFQEPAANRLSTKKISFSRIYFRRPHIFLMTFRYASADTELTPSGRHWTLGCDSASGPGMQSLFYSP